MTCSQRSWVPNARTPRTWVTVLASQPSESMETETTQRIDSPRRPGLPTVFITSRRSSLSVMASASSRLPERCNRSWRNRSISSPAASRKLASRLSSDSSCWLSMSRVWGRARGLPSSSKLRNSYMGSPYFSFAISSRTVRSSILHTGLFSGKCHGKPLTSGISSMRCAKHLAIINL